MNDHAPESTPSPGTWVLIVEDSPTQAERLRYLLEKNGYQVLAAGNGRQALAILETQQPELVISDIMMPEMDGYQLCRQIKLNERSKHLPVILLTSLSRSEDVLEGLECGADYFITKPYSESYLLLSVEQILQNRKLHGLDHVRIGTEIMVGGKSRLITTDQQQTLSLLISTYEAAVRTNSDLLQAQEELRTLNTHLEDLVAERTAALSEEIEVRRQSEGRVRQLNNILRAIRSVNALIVTEKSPERLAQEACRILIEHRGYGNALLLLDDGQGNTQVHAALGLQQPQEPPGSWWLPACARQALTSQAIFHVAQRQPFCDGCPLNERSPQSDALCAPLSHNGKVHGYLVVYLDQAWAGDQENRELFAEMVNDLAAALYNLEQAEAMRLAEKERLRMEAELRQAQKMEAVGRLAGGVAHDFNNMLGVILGYADMALASLEPDSAVHGYVKEIEKASERSADLTRQLLAFSSRQMVTPKVIDLNQVIGDLQKMLTRLIGEDIEFKFLRGEDLWSLLVDPSQVNQILANLAVNARDAMEGAGAITIETSNVNLSEEYCCQFVQAQPGDYVMLAFSDTGMGMDAELLSHIFEPFFTTKGEGKGTGLGLATVFGIVKQYDGFIHTYSEPGLGTTFKIYFPRFLGQAETTQRETPERPSQGSESILVVEDEKQLLTLVKAVLESYGHTVLAAGTPREALSLLLEHPGRLDLLLTDMVMPEMNGKELQKEVQALQPGIKTLFMSGYTASTVVHRGLLEEKGLFLSKPFTINQLVHKVREALDR